ncbi:peptide/nickel transport system permease protein [Gibbsiella quercinecans]|uniref:Peptide ABC transporter n=1 Tax=Gibbsiella quercinecans TaxID=929813 RepID=A0A250AVP4_9GAMM|nr:ABC transporter permease [Gibbsiella quercinecans]ATA17989.1 peptide ABC transporter [Gibbsiella quercinecans]RLM04625.1 peptide ABC transporter [Gibbsiella quercinecans]RLM09490.1 peptide ABC transporter [Gibbsiella quercinecans]TCT92303.1 peptide/nickel transport system permease protein [Gibbsiella quercinecans]
MVQFLLSRLLSAIPTLLLVTVLVFLLTRLVPGDPALLMLGDMATEASLADLRHSMGLDQTLPQQFLIWFSQVLHGDFGHSIQTGQAVLPLILQRFGVTLSVVLAAIIIASLLAVPAGMLAAWKQNSRWDIGLVMFSTFLLSIPSFWMGLLVLLTFGLSLGWLPVVGYVSVADNLQLGVLYLLMPVLTLVLVEMGALVRMMRASTLEVLRLDYVTHARAKGLPERRVLARHVFPNAFGPTWTLIGLTLGNLLSGVAVTETVFSLPGLGRLLVDAIYARDYPVIQGCMLFIAALYVLTNLLIDALYPLFNPRVTA